MVDSTTPEMVDVAAQSVKRWHYDHHQAVKGQERHDNEHHGMAQHPIHQITHHTTYNPIYH